MTATLKKASDAKWLKPLIDGKYAEFPYARITVFVNKKFSVDWQRHTGQWIQLAEENSLIESLEFIDNKPAFF
ncbi:MAG: hypothetical protein HY738_14680 [Bacteroidia bacterium]|nr:hypothetical protein [Bacteroidia bacterium]